MGFVKAMDDLPLIVKIILAIPVLHIIWDIYRLVKAIVKKNTVGIIVAIIVFFFTWIFWIVDIILLLVKGNVFELNN